MPFSAIPGVASEAFQGFAPAPTKTCILCEETKPHSEFNKDNRNKVDGLFNVCKACKKEQRKAKAEGREPVRARRSGGGRPRTRSLDAPLVALAKAIEAHAREELEAQRYNAMVERESAKNQARCQAYVDWLICNDGRPVRWGEVSVNPMVFAVAREGGSMWSWPEATEEDHGMAERYGRLPCLWSMSLEDALRYPEWLHLYDGWNPTNFLNYSEWVGLKRRADHAILHAFGGQFEVFAFSGIDVDDAWDAMLSAN